MKKVFALSFAFSALLSLGGTIDALVAFDSAKLSCSDRDGMEFYSYDEKDVNYVEHGDGAPVLPCRHIYVVAPKGAAYKGCRTQVTREKVQGIHKLYTRNPKGLKSEDASQFPKQVVEFVKQYDEAGFRIFMFRVYPIACQPADGSLNRILSCQLQITCEGDSRYENVPMDSLKAVKAKVVNPRSLESLVASLQAKETPQTAALQGFALEKGKAGRKSSMTASQGFYQKPRQVSAAESFVNTISDNVSLSDGSVMFTPLKF